MMRGIISLFSIFALFFCSCCTDESSDGKVEMTYFSDGALQKETRFSADGDDWEITKYFEDGTISSHANYHKGKYVGEAIIYFPNGQKNFVQNYDSLGLPDGPYFLFTKDGVLRESGNYVHGEREGEWHTFDKEGNVSTTALYKDGKVLRKR